MWVLLAVGFLLPFIYFGYLMSKLDNFLTKNSIALEAAEACPSAIVLGRTELANQTIKLLEDNKICVLHLTEPFLPKQEQHIGYLFALSENDADNIVLSKIGRKRLSLEEMISVCNDPKNERMFIGEKINYRFADKTTAKILYQAVLGAMEVKL